ncbi:MAG TPA: hypothetical protein VKR58_01130, partial [Aquella sp.]|nr:hypothetical protein [Aquella sp.]
SKGEFVAVGEKGTILTSSVGSDGTITWNQAKSGTSNWLNSIAVNSKGEFVAVGDYGTILTSSIGSDGTITWNQICNKPTKADIQKASYLPSDTLAHNGIAHIEITAKSPIANGMEIWNFDGSKKLAESPFRGIFLEDIIKKRNSVYKYKVRNVCSGTYSKFYTLEIKENNN